MLVQIPVFKNEDRQFYGGLRPSSNCNADDVQQFYTNIEAVLDRIKPRHTLILTGDLNSETGIRQTE